MGIEALNELQLEMLAADSRKVELIAPTGSGKTLAFGVYLLKRLKAPGSGIQAVTIVPSRELALQVGEVFRRIAVGYKTSVFYGGHPMVEEIKSLSATPDILVATPGRLVDHMNRATLSVADVRMLVLDEYDKSLELGFEVEMKRILRAMTSLHNVVLTSATRLANMPAYLPDAPTMVVESKSNDPRIRTDIVHVESPMRDKMQTLVDLLESLPDGKAIVFVNHRESAERVYDHLRKAKMPAGIYHGGLEQRERELAVDLLNNGTTPILVTTDLASRGLDIAAVDNVIHYHLPPSAEAWVHRNGRTARMGADGCVYVITSEADNIPEYVEWEREYVPSHKNANPIMSHNATLYLNLGKKEKISRGDILGFLMANTGVESSSIGRIIVKDHSAIAAVDRNKASEMLKMLEGCKIKNKRVKITLLR